MRSGAVATAVVDDQIDDAVKFGNEGPKTGERGLGRGPRVELQLRVRQGLAQRTRPVLVPEQRVVPAHLMAKERERRLQFPRHTGNREVGCDAVDGAGTGTTVGGGGNGGVFLVMIGAGAAVRRMSGASADRGRRAGCREGSNCGVIRVSRVMRGRGSCC